MKTFLVIFNVEIGSEFPGSNISYILKDKFITGKNEKDAIDNYIKKFIIDNYGNDPSEDDIEETNKYLFSEEVCVIEVANTKVYVKDNTD